MTEQSQADKFRYVQRQMLARIRSEEGILYSRFTKQERRLIDYMEKRGMVTTEPIKNDWIVR